jgi:outer membrane protein assembly factor BamB
MKSATFAVRIGGKDDVTESQGIWTETKGIPEVPSALLYRGRLYYVKNGGVLTSRDPATGKMIFEERLGAPGGYYASPVAADGRIYVASDRGMVTVVEAGDRLQVLARADLKEAIMATPAIVDDRLSSGARRICGPLGQADDVRLPWMQHQNKANRKEKV